MDEEDVNVTTVFLTKSLHTTFYTTVNPTVTKGTISQEESHTVKETVSHTSIIPVTTVEPYSTDSVVTLIVYTSDGRAVSSKTLHNGEQPTETNSPPHTSSDSETSSSPTTSSQDERSTSSTKSISKSTSVSKHETTDTSLTSSSSLSSSKKSANSPSSITSVSTHSTPKHSSTLSHVTSTSSKAQLKSKTTSSPSSISSSNSPTSTATEATSQTRLASSSTYSASSSDIINSSYLSSSSPTAAITTRSTTTSSTSTTPRSYLPPKSTYQIVTHSSQVISVHRERQHTSTYTKWIPYETTSSLIESDATETADKSDPRESKPSTAHTGKIAAAVVVPVCALVALGGMILFFLRRSKQKRISRSLIMEDVGNYGFDPNGLTQEPKHPGGESSW